MLKKLEKGWRTDCNKVSRTQDIVQKRDNQRREKANPAYTGLPEYVQDNGSGIGRFAADAAFSEAAYGTGRYWGAQADIPAQWNGTGATLTGAGGNGIVQMYTLDEVDKIFARFAEKKWDISEEECVRLLESVDRGETPRIGNHNAVLMRCRNNTLRIEKRKFSGAGMMGRIAKEGGIEYDAADITGDYSFESITGSVQRGVVLDKESLRSLPSREALTSVMGQSASSLTKIVGAEYLHIIAHQLGGPDKEDNLRPGLHALNTAMIPFENFVRDLLISNDHVGYFVTMIPKPGEAWAAEAAIEIIIVRDGKQLGRMYRLCLKAEPDKAVLLSQASLDGIKAVIAQFKSDFGIL